MAKAQVSVRLDKEQLARAKKALGAETVTQPIGRALLLATEKAARDKVLRKYSGVGRKNSFRQYETVRVGQACEKDFKALLPTKS